MDRENVIKSIKACAHHPDHDCESCDYCGDNFWCFNDQLIKDFETLLNEQEASIEQLNRFVNGFSRDAMPVVRCKDCRYGQYCTDGETTYQCFKWNSGEFGMLHEQNWFCADGELR